MALRDGVWSATTPPQAPEIYWYNFNVDGIAGLDPQNGEVYPNLAFLNSFVTVPGHPPAIWEERDVPHGVVHHHYFASRLLRGRPGGRDDYVVYTPPGYDPGRPKPYPVLYLLHGFGQTAANWTLEGRAQVILDNLIAAAKAKPMILVMPFGYGDMAVLPDHWEGKIADNNTVFGEILLREILPRIEHDYHVARDRGGRAIAGLSMGGLQTLNLAFNHPEAFAYIGPFSASAADYHETPFAAALTPRQADFRLLWFGCGIHESDGTGDDNLTENRKVEARLRARGFIVEEAPLPGMHTWMVWHECLNRFAPQLFADH
jgi:enterochelin esterase family protein